MALSDRGGRSRPTPTGGLRTNPGEAAYVFVPMTVETNCVMLLEAVGDDLAYVNGEPRAGDPYEHGYVHLPVALHPGTNDLLFRCSRGRLKVTLATPSAPIALDLTDQTLPDLVVGETADTWGAVVVVNATAEARRGLILRAALAGQRATETPVPDIPPLTVRKVGFRLRGRPPGSGETAPVALTLLADKRHVLHSASLTLRVRRPDQTQKRTFISDIDGSVQYRALNPAQPVGRNAPPPALFLTVHGASVEAIGQADAYSPKTWGNIVAPTNRRPYGFDWESWGRLDALEVLAAAKAQLHPDPQRIYLTGHSMGGHGAWQLAALFPDHFAAVGPSAGWISFFSYANARRFTNATPVEALLQRASASSDTLLMETNYLQEGVYILHGAEDDNVPVEQARTMAKQLARFHHDFQYHEQPGVRPLVGYFGRAGRRLRGLGADVRLLRAPCDPDRPEPPPDQLYDRQPRRLGPLPLAGDRAANPPSGEKRGGRSLGPGQTAVCRPDGKRRAACLQPAPRQVRSTFEGRTGRRDSGQNPLAE